jgi:uncharacterized protein
VYLLLGIALAGFLAQLIDGSLGMGYGVSSTTLLLTVGLTPALASASVHLAEIGTTAVSGASHWRLGNVDMKIMALLAIPGGIGAFLGAVVLSNLSTEEARPWVSVVLLVLGAVIVFRFLHARRTRQAPAVFHDQPIQPADAAPRRSRRWMLTPLGVAGGFLDASGGGGWGPVVTSTLMASGRLKPRTIIGTVSMSEFVVAISASVGFLLALGAAGIRWDIVAMMLVGGSIAAPVAAWLVRKFDDRALGTAVGAVIVLLNVDRLLVLIGMDSSLVTAVRLLAIAAAAVIIGLLVWRGRASRDSVEGAAARA